MGKDSICYFGTSIGRPGHYFWNISEEGLDGLNISFSVLPFNPEELPRHPKGAYHHFNNGHCEFYNENGYSILAITGSCADHRPNSKSIFFVKEDISARELLDRLQSLRIFQEMVSKMDFRIELEKVLNV